MFRWRCERLNAQFVHHPCADRRRAGTFACVDCDGPIETEGESMASLCKVEGCTKQVQINGMCKSHFHGTPPRVVKVRPEVASVPAVSDAEIHVINLVELFRQKQAAELDSFISGLSQCTTARTRLEYVYARVCL